MGDLKDRTILITGASRGIGEAIAVRAGRDGANVVLAAKTDRPHPKLPGTLHSAAEAVEEAGGKALVCVCDIRDDEQVQGAVARAVNVFGGIDVLVNNASAIYLAGTVDTPMKRFDLMHGVNVRGTYAMSQACIPYLEKSTNPHILNISPPLNMDAKWFAPNVAYTMSKYGMSMCVLGMAEELRKAGIGVNALWPRTTIATAAVQNLLGGDAIVKKSRTAEIVADAAQVIVTRDSRGCTGNFFVDEQVLRDEGVSEFGRYAVDPGQDLQDDFFL